MMSREPTVRTVIEELKCCDPEATNGKKVKVVVMV